MCPTFEHHCLVLCKTSSMLFSVIVMLPAIINVIRNKKKKEYNKISDYKKGFPFAFNTVTNVIYFKCLLLHISKNTFISLPVYNTILCIYLALKVKMEKYLGRRQISLYHNHQHHCYQRIFVENRPSSMLKRTKMCKILLYYTIFCTFCTDPNHFVNSEYGKT